MRLSIKLEDIQAIVRYILMIVSSVVLIFYMNLSNAILWGLLVGILGILGFRKMPRSMCDKKTTISIGLFSLLISLFIVLGKHLNIDATQMYHGTADVNYILSYSNMDWIAILLISYCVFQFMVLIKKMGQQYRRQICTIHFECKIQVKWILLFMVILFALWLPYLYTYYPGFYFGDSSSNVAQALGIQPLDNHHPVMYILLIRFCIKIGIWLGNLARGLALFSLIQMLFMAWGVSYFVNWLQVRMGLGRVISLVMLCIYGASPYIAQYTIAIWKDPIFSIAVVLVTICLAECLLCEAMAKQKVGWYIKLSLALFLMVFSRNNGIYIVYTLMIIVIISLINRQIRKRTARLLLVCAIVVGVSQYVMGPIYNRCGVVQSDEKVESYGILVAQMARTVVMNGKLSEKDLQYMNRMLPIDDYQMAYTPCCVDNMKWNPNFHKEMLDKGFFKTYFSILKKNPKIYFEAWELQTYGFWALNQPIVNNFEGNIVAGVPRNIYPENGLGVEGLALKTVDVNSTQVKLFPYTAKCIPVAYVHWLLIGLALFALIRGNWRRLVVLAPALGLMATLIIASPICYWPRYGLAQQLLLPLFIIMIFVREGEANNG